GEYEEFIKREPKAGRWIKKLVGSEEFLNNKERYCLWLVDCPPNELRSMPFVLNRVEACRADRLKGADDRKKLAETPTIFRETNNPDSFIIVPTISSERRRYIPIGYADADSIPSNSLQIVPDATLYLFGILQSNVHMAWMRATCGRLEMRYSYSIKIVYNNFPFPEPTDDQRAAIEKTAQAILDARKPYHKSSLADLYDVNTMPKELREAHHANDRAVMKCYGLPRNTPEDKIEDKIVALLMERYKALTAKK
ncbi:MAG: methylase, partial [Bacteroidales bacterium]|nr:methylase [Bacteroidales bacterium]